VAGGQRLERPIFFDNKPGDEYMSVIWTTQPIPELEAICKDAAKTDFEIKNPAQIETLTAFLANHESPAVKADVDHDKKQTTVTGTGDIIVYSGKEKGKELVLKHRTF